MYCFKMAKHGKQQHGKQNNQNKFYFKKKKNKLSLVFDENARREFLTGFRKRKQQRKKFAAEKFETEIKAERKRIKKEAKEAYLKLVTSSRTVPEVEHLLQEEIDLEDHSVTITELSTSTLARQNDWIGENKVLYEDIKQEEDSETEEDDFGMELKPKPKKEIKEEPKEEFRTKKELKKVLKLHATKSVKESKVFQKKVRMERVQNIKLKKKRERLEEKNMKQKLKKKR